jgi:RNA:NAD 2'-phosphotransferase (TPT1/KptA family)
MGHGENGTVGGLPLIGIRAVQGHSLPMINAARLYVPIRGPLTRAIRKIVHGTFNEALPGMCSSGIIPGVARRKG